MAGVDCARAAAGGDTPGATADRAHLGMDRRLRGVSRDPELDSPYDDQLRRGACSPELWDFAAAGGIRRLVCRRVHRRLGLERATLADGGVAGRASAMGSFGVGARPCLERLSVGEPGVLAISESASH